MPGPDEALSFRDETADNGAMGELAVDLDGFRGHDARGGPRVQLRVVECEDDATALPDGIDPELLASELVLVCPELRALALVRLPERDPDGFAPRRSKTEPRLVIAPPAVTHPPSPEAAPVPKARQGVRQLAVAALVHAAGQVMFAAVAGAVILVGVGGIVLLATSVR